MFLLGSPPVSDAPSRSSCAAGFFLTSCPPVASVRAVKAKTVAKLADLKPNERNPRLPFNEDERAAFLRSLQEFGDLSGIVRNRRTDQLVGGHKRVETFSSLNNAQITVTDRLKIPDATGTIAFGYVTVAGTRWSYREVDWTEDKEIAANLAANLAANQFGAEFDWQGVSELLKQIDGKQDLLLTGFPQHELDNLLKADWTVPQAGEMPTQAHGGKIDPIHLTAEARAALDAAKVKLGEAEDVAAIVKLCEYYTISNSDGMASGKRGKDGN